MPRIRKTHAFTFTDEEYRAMTARVPYATGKKTFKKLSHLIVHAVLRLPAPK